MHLTKERENLYQGKQHHYKSQMCVWVFFFPLYLFIYLFFRATPMAYGSPQARA